MDLDVNFDQSQSSLPSGFVAAVDYVVSYFDSLFTNNVTVTINVGFGEIGGQTLPAGDLGESEQVNVSSVGYSAVRNALVAEGTTGSATLPAASPAPASDTLLMASSDEKALGLIANNTTLDGYVGFDSAPNTFSYAINSAPPAGEYYFVGALEHEITEVMGRTSYLDISRAYSLMDLFRYSAANTRQFTTGAASYFSINNGVTDLNNWNNFQTGNDGDLGDWAPSAGNDAFDDNGNPGVINVISAADLTLMNALGWVTTPTPTPAPTPTPTPTSPSVTGFEWENATGAVTVWTVSGAQIDPSNTGDATFDGAVYHMTSDWHVLGTGDFFGVSDADILWQNSYSDAVEIWEMHGTQIDPSNSTYATFDGNIHPMTSDWQYRDVGNFFGNTTDDILWQNSYADIFEIWEMHGTQIDPSNSGYVTFDGAIYQMTHDLQYLGVGDFFGNGGSDILLHNIYNNTSLILEMNGTQINPGNSSYVTMNGSIYVSPPGWDYLGTGDFFDNGYDDALWQNPSNGVVLIWEMNGLQIDPSNSRYVTLNGSASAAAASVQGYTFLKTFDFNSDGYSDIAWLNSSNGDVQIWEMNGTQIVSDSLVTLNGSTESSTQAGTPIISLSANGALQTSAPVIDAGAGTPSANFPSSGARQTGAAEGAGASGALGPVIGNGTLYLAPNESTGGPITFSPGSMGALYDASGLADTVVGFDEGANHLSFTGETATNEAAVVASAVTTNGNTLLTFPDHTSLLLIGVSHVDTSIFA